VCVGVYLKILKNQHKFLCATYVAVKKFKNKMHIKITESQRQ